MRFINAKKILSNWSSGENWFGQNYGMNIYKGCNHGCIYCDSRSSCYGIDNFDKVRAKKNVLTLLEKELKSKRKKGIVGTGGMSDPYNPFELKHKLTRGALELIYRYGFGISILTKSYLVVRDIDILKKIKTHSPAMVKFTITTFDDELCRKIEPNVVESSKRFLALRHLSQAGILTGILIWPILPFINDTKENIRLIVKAAAENGARFVMPYFGVTLRHNQRQYFYKKLDILFPGIKQKYIRTYGGSYECYSVNQRELLSILITECEKYGLLYKMPDIIKNLKNDYEYRQISFL